MKRLLTTALALAAATGGLIYALGNTRESRAEAVAYSVRDQFVGNWELLSYVSFDSTGQARDMGYVGRIMYDQYGNMAAVGMPIDLPSRPRVEGQPRPTAGFAYFSTFDVDEETGRVIHHVEGSPMNPNWVNTDLIRYYEFRGDTLALSIRNPDGRVTGTLTWKRFGESVR